MWNPFKSRVQGKFIVVNELSHDCKTPSLEQMIKQNVDFGCIWICLTCGDSWILERYYPVLDQGLNLRDAQKGHINNAYVTAYIWRRKNIYQLESL